MKAINNQIFTILFFAVALGVKSSGQQYKTQDTIHLKEVIIPSGFPIDTSVQKILFVLEMQPIRNEPCELLDFTVLYDNYTGIKFNMGAVINVSGIYWAFHQDSIIFFSSGNYIKIRHIKKPDQIEKYLLDHGERTNDGLIQDTPGYYWTYSKLSRYSYLFKKEEKLSNCQLEYYNRHIGK
jgi:hypothetical protein